MVIIFYNRLCKNLQHYLVTKLFGELMNDKFKKRSIVLFILTVICFICGFGFLLSAAITAPLFTLDSGAINLFEFLCDYGLKFILISVPYYAFALLFIHSQKRLSESEKASTTADIKAIYFFDFNSFNFIYKLSYFYIYNKYTKL